MTTERKDGDLLANIKPVSENELQSIMRAEEEAKLKAELAWMQRPCGNCSMPWDKHFKVQRPWDGFVGITGSAPPPLAVLCPWTVFTEDTSQRDIMAAARSLLRRCQCNHRLFDHEDFENRCELCACEKFRTPLRVATEPRLGSEGEK